MDIETARRHADSGKAVIASYSGERSRYLTFTRNGDGVDVRLFKTHIARITEAGTYVWTGGYNTATTFEALRFLDIGVSNDKHIPYIGGTRMTEGAFVGNDGTVVSTAKLTPKR